MSRSRLEDLGRILELAELALQSAAFDLGQDIDTPKYNDIRGLKDLLLRIHEIASGQDYLNEDPQNPRL